MARGLWLLVVMTAYVQAKETEEDQSNTPDTIKVIIGLVMFATALALYVR